MSSLWECPRCGCRTKHFSTSRGQYICDACGHAVENENERIRREQIAQSIYRAKENLRVGNWDYCCSIVRPLLTECPSDPTLYLLLLASLTKGYEDYMLDGDDRRLKECADLWDKLDRLNCTNHTMQKYAESRISQRCGRLTSRICLGAALSIGFAAGVITAYYLCSFPVSLFTVVYGFFAIKWMNKHTKPISALRELTTVNKSNPFR